MSPDELLVTVAAVFFGPVLWTVWLLRMSRLQTVQYRRAGTAPIAIALALCVVLVFGILKTGASFDVVDAPRYLFMYVVLGLAWSRVSEMAFAYAGVSARDDVIERGNSAAVPAVIGGLVAVTLCYAGGNIGDGPGWWVVVFSAGLATGTLLLAWLALSHLTAVTDAVTIDRDPAAGLRLGAFLVSSGLVLGWAVAGDWHSARATVTDLVVVLPAILAILIGALIVERLARPTPQVPHLPLVAYGLLPATLYICIAIATLSWLGWPT
jgi:hypothetical protein